METCKLELIQLKSVTNQKPYQDIFPQPTLHLGLSTRVMDPCIMLRLPFGFRIIHGTRTHFKKRRSIWDANPFRAFSSYGTLTHFEIHIFYGTLTHLVELWDSNPIWLMRSNNACISILTFNKHHNL